jgi:hypothetical protein
VTTTKPPVREVFSSRLETFLDELKEGETPNSGTFCGYCYNPMPPEQAVCDHCGRDRASTPAANTVPPAVIELHRRKQKRESLVVNSFAYLGLGLGLLLFLIVVAINFYFFDTALWLFIISLLVLLVGGRGLAGVFGGWIGDEVGYRYANRKLAEEWDAYTGEQAL